MSGKTLLASLLASCGLTAAATATAGAVASGQPGMSAEDQTAGTESLEKLVEAAHEEGRMAGAKEGAKAERARFGTVLTSENAVGRIGLAITLLSTTDNTPEQIDGALKASPKEIAATTAAPAGGAQRQAGDPLAADAIADDTALIDTGANRPPADGLDEKAIVDLWSGALGRAGGVTEGGPWGALDRPPGQAAN